MKYYNSYGKLVEFKNDISFNHGTCANIYKVNFQESFKVYYKYTKTTSRMKKEIFDIIKKINHQNVYKLLDVFYEESNVSNVLSLINNPNRFRIDAYNYFYVFEKEIDIFNVDVSYLLQSINGLENFLEIISELGIRVYDFRRENIVYTDEGIILIDLDCLCFEENNINVNFIKNKNKEKLINLLKDLFIKNQKYLKRYKENLDELFDVNMTDNIYKEVSKKLVKVKSVSNYLGE